MSNWQNRLLLYIQSEMNRLFDRPPIGAGFNFSYMDRKDMLKRYPGDWTEEEYQTAWEIEIDELTFVIDSNVTNHWALNEDIAQDIQIWGDKGTTYIHFEDENNWYEIEVRQ